MSYTFLLLLFVLTLLFPCLKIMASVQKSPSGKDSDKPETQEQRRPEENELQKRLEQIRQGIQQVAEDLQQQEREREQRRRETDELQKRLERTRQQIDEFEKELRQ